MDLEKRPDSPEKLHKAHDRHEDDDHLSINDDTLEHRDDSTETQYVCPMHLDVVEGEPGRCPICGMFLEEQENEGGGK
jgi:Cu(I)/Ag(I) efflux system membrane fusion protein